MQGFLNRINKAVEYRWNEYQERFPGFFYYDENGQKNMPKIIAAQTMMNLPDFPTYARRYVDQDPTSYYFMMNASPLAGPSDRDTAVEFFFDLFHEKLHMNSSYTDEEGLDPYEAADKEVLPAALDKNYKNFYEKQMEKLAKMMGGADTEADKKNKDDEFEKKMGFRKDDPNIIDVTPDGEQRVDKREPGIEKAQNFQVGALKKIWYAVDIHVPVGMELGFNGRDNRLRGRRDDMRFIREADASKKEIKLNELIAMCKPQSELWNALLDIKEKFNLKDTDIAADKVNEVADEVLDEVADDVLDESAVLFWNNLSRE